VLARGDDLAREHDRVDVAVAEVADAGEPACAARRRD
jgi:hypothetical protein